MKWQLLGGPLDEAVVETPEHAIQPEMFHFSDSRRVHHYLWHEGTEFRYQSQDTIIDDPALFEAWWKGQNYHASMKEAAWGAWQAVLNRF